MLCLSFQIILSNSSTILERILISVVPFIRINPWSCWSALLSKIHWKNNLVDCIIQIYFLFFFFFCFSNGCQFFLGDSSKLKHSQNKWTVTTTLYHYRRKSLQKEFVVGEVIRLKLYIEIWNKTSKKGTILVGVLTTCLPKKKIPLFRCVQKPLLKWCSFLQNFGA